MAGPRGRPVRGCCVAGSGALHIGHPVWPWFPAGGQAPDAGPYRVLSRRAAQVSRFLRTAPVLPVSARPVDAGLSVRIPAAIRCRSTSRRSALGSCLAAQSLSHESSCRFAIAPPPCPVSAFLCPPDCLAHSRLAAGNLSTPFSLDYWTRWRPGSLLVSGRMRPAGKDRGSARWHSAGRTGCSPVHQRQWGLRCPAPAGASLPGHRPEPAPRQHRREPPRSVGVRHVGA